MSNKVTPILLLSGFLGSGKTTFLLNILDEVSKKGLKPAILLNELGEVNVEGQLISTAIPTSELLGGCICCTSKGDLTGELHQLIRNYSPDLVIVESTGVAHPLETIDAITELSFYVPIRLSDVITIVNSKQFLSTYHGRKSESSRLLKEQIMCASRLIMNKMDLLEGEEHVTVEHFVREWNQHASIHKTVRANLPKWDWLETIFDVNYERNIGKKLENHGEEHHCTHGEGEVCTHQSHHHVMSYTHYFQSPIHSEMFESWLKQLPEHIYRAKGIISFSDINSRFLFQFAYRETDFIKITPQGEVLDVAVFIGEHFNRDWLIEQLTKLEKGI